MAEAKSLLRRHADYYAGKMGLRIFPCNGKVPATAHGCKDATSDLEQVAEWWSGNSGYNIGIATGNGIVVLDVDIDHDAGKYGDETLKALEQEHGPLPDTWTCLTGGGGIHYYFSCDDPALTVGTSIAPGLDFRGAGGYVIAPPSRHASGRLYEWEASNTPTSAPLAPLPDWLHRLMAKDTPTEKPSSREAPGKVTEGTRNAEMFKLAASLRAKGLTVDEIAAAVQTANKNRCDPPLDEREIETICKSTGRYERGEPAKTDPPPTLSTISAADLQRKDIPPIRFIVDNLLTVGLNILASPPKYGKSWMVLDLGLSVTSGGRFLGYQTSKADVLYLALEDSKRRLKARMGKLLAGKPAPAGFHFATTAHTTDNGLFDELDGFLKEHPDTALIIIDTLQRVRGATHGKEGAYAADYREVGALKAFADSHNVALLLVHHLRKMADDSDPFNRISGTNGIMGAADTTMVLTKEKRGDDNATLSIVGRDVESADTVLRFNKGTCRWENLGDADWFAEQHARREYQASPTVKTIKKLLEQSPDGTWNGTAQQLLDAGTFIARTRLATSARDLTAQLKQMDKLLFEYDSIVHERKSHGTGGGKHRFYYADLPLFEEIPGEENKPFLPT